VRHRTDATPCKSVKYRYSNRKSVNGELPREKAWNKSPKPLARDELLGFKTNLRQVTDCTTSQFRSCPGHATEPISSGLILGETPLVTLLWGY
jgi:hypothetical protein